jgi:hypothetical protein
VGAADGWVGPALAPPALAAGTGLLGGRRPPALVGVLLALLLLEPPLLSGTGVGTFCDTLKERPSRTLGGEAVGVGEPCVWGIEGADSLTLMLLVADTGDDMMRVAAVAADALGERLASDAEAPDSV